MDRDDVEIDDDDDNDVVVDDDDDDDDDDEGSAGSFVVKEGDDDETAIEVVNNNNDNKVVVAVVNNVENKVENDNNVDNNVVDDDDDEFDEEDLKKQFADLISSSKSILEVIKGYKGRCYNRAGHGFRLFDDCDEAEKCQNGKPCQCKKFDYDAFVRVMMLSAMFTNDYINGNVAFFNGGKLNLLLDSMKTEYKSNIRHVDRIKAILNAFVDKKIERCRKKSALHLCLTSGKDKMFVFIPIVLQEQVICDISGRKIDSGVSCYTMREPGFPENDKIVCEDVKNVIFATNFIAFNDQFVTAILRQIYVVAYPSWQNENYSKTFMNYCEMFNSDHDFQDGLHSLLMRAINILNVIQ